MILVILEDVAQRELLHGPRKATGTSKARSSAYVLPNLVEHPISSTPSDFQNQVFLGKPRDGQFQYCRINEFEQPRRVGFWNVAGDLDCKRLDSDCRSVFAAAFPTVNPR